MTKVPNSKSCIIAPEKGEIGKSRGYPYQPFFVQTFPKYFSPSWIIKHICCCLFKSLFNWSPRFFTSFSKLVGIPTDSCENTAAEMGFKFRTQISMKSETDFKYFCLFRCAIIKSLVIVSFLDKICLHTDTLSNTAFCTLIVF